MIIGFDNTGRIIYAGGPPAGNRYDWSYDWWLPRRVTPPPPEPLPPPEPEPVYPYRTAQSAMAMLPASPDRKPT